MLRLALMHPRAFGSPGEKSGSRAPRGSRTPNRQIRSLMLYPVELWAQRGMPRFRYFLSSHNLTRDNP